MFSSLSWSRLLVNQTTDHLFDKAGVDCVPIDGRIPQLRRKELSNPQW